uniref:Alkylmercury lyase n=1 Tax=Leptospirillum ferriphilum TaxID=178606 RepID=A0A7C3R3Q7_9BACT
MSVHFGSDRVSSFLRIGCPLSVRTGVLFDQNTHPETACVTFPLPSSNQHIRESFCCHTHFLASKNEAYEWLKDHPFASFLSLSEAYDIGQEMHKSLFVNALC